MYQRTIKNQIKSTFFKGKALFIIGPRQVGKTTLSREVIREFDHKGKKSISFNCDNPTDREALNEKDLEYLEKLIGTKTIIFIDEGQKVKTIGQSVKLLVDKFGKQKQIIVTGSSSINLLNRSSEALTGRKKVFTLYPLSLKEIYPDKNPLLISKNLETLLIFGSYPEVVMMESFEQKRDLLRELSTSSLYKDILEFQLVKNSDVIYNLLKALALQIGSEVSYNELANLLNIDKKTVERYIDLLEKNYVIFKLSPFFTNKRKEISKSKKIYFYDLGIRNIIINNFNFLDSRTDGGALWENFMIIERLKQQAYSNLHANNYFWRTYTQTEIDWLEERDGRLFGYEFKFSPKNKYKIPTEFQKNYQNAQVKIINSENYLDFLDF